MGACLMGMPAQAQLVINELMQSNVNCIMDDLNEFPDSWIELYNAGTTTINLNDYRLGINSKAADAWQLPEQSVAPHQYILVYGDKEADGLHANFRLESGKGGGVWLFQGQEIVDKVTDLKKQPAPNIAYGRETDGSSTWGYQLKTTPKSMNTGGISNQILGDPIFSEKGRVVTDGKAILLEFSLPEGSPEGTEIYLTTDGSEPTLNSRKYTDPITISNTRIIRARLFCDNWISPPSVTQSYIFFTRELTLPVVSITTDRKYLSDSKIGINVDGSYQKGKKNYEFNWRRPMNIEFFEGGGVPSAINQLCEARIAGGATRNVGLKSMAVYAHKRFGTKYFNYEFFPDQKPGINEFKSIMLRNSGNDFDYLYMRDPIVQRTLASHVDIDWQAWQPAIVYINGTYKGMLNIRERSNEDNIWSNYDHLEDIDMVENWKDLKEGDWDHFNRLMAFAKEEGHSLAEFDEWIDCSEYADLMLINLYFNNFDTPGNNWMMWRPRTKDGRWRFVAKDMDYTLGLYGEAASYKILEWLYNPNYDYNHNWGANGSDATLLFRRLMDDKDFHRLFIDRASIYMGDFLNKKGVRAIWDPMYEMIKNEFPNHRQLYMHNQWWPRNYDEELRDARNWLTQRTNIFYRQLGDFYKLGTPISMTVNKQSDIEMELTFNGIRLSGSSFSGKFFKNRDVTIEGKAPEGKVITGWNILTVSSSGAITEKVNGEVCQFVMPDCSSLAVDAILSDVSGILSAAEANSWTWHRDGQQLVVSGVPAGSRIQLFGINGIRLYSVVADGSPVTFHLSSGNLHILQVGEKVVKL